MKLVVSIMPRSLEEAQQLDSSRYEDADVIEWRADFLEKSEILTVAPAVFEKFAGREILFTLRTRAEGGGMELTNEEYVGILKDIQSIYHPDYIDFEYYSHREVFEEMLEFSNLVLSYHNFQETPENMMEILSELTSFSPKLVKVSVMAHNEQDVLAACLSAHFAGVTAVNMARVLKDFRGVEHRLEYVTTINGVKYYNDSKATNTDSAIKALEAFKDGHVIILAGGHDKMTGLDDLMETIKAKTDALILLGEARQRFYEAAQKHGVQHIIMIDGTFEDAVRKAYSLARAPQVVLLSPACSSYDMFANFPERGRVFKQIVHDLAKEAEA